MASVLYCLPTDIKTASATLSLTAGAANASYPLVNLQDLNPAKPFNATGTSCTIKATFGGATSLTAVSFGPHNLTGATVAISNNGGMGSTAIPIAANREDGLSVNPYLSFAASSATEWSIAISGAAANVAIGELQLIATLRTIPIRWGFQEGEKHQTITHETDHGVRLKYWLGVSQRRYLGRVSLESFRASLLTLIRSAQGQYKSFLLVPDSTVNEALLVDLTSDERVVTRAIPLASEVDLEFTELQRGPAL